MLLHIYVVDNSGMPVYARCVGHDTCPLGSVDTIAISGLLTALVNFADEIGGETIDEITMQKTKFLIRTEPKFFTTFQLGSGKNIKKHQKSIYLLSIFIKTIYLESAPTNIKEREKLKQKIDKFLDETGLLTESIPERIKTYISKIFKE